MRVLVDKIEYEVIDICGCCKPKEVCILQSFDFADGTTKQLRIWTKNYKIIKD